MTERVIPPYNGFGTEEDSLSNCLSLLPRPPRRDFARFMEADRAGVDLQVLRFLARLELAKPDPSGINEQRRFIVSYFLTDGTMSVFEQSSRNTGTYPNQRCHCLDDQSMVLVSVAQLVARRTNDRKVVGSIPANAVCFTVDR